MQTDDLDRIQQFRHGGQVKRYHTWPTLREQSVGAHSHGVAMIIMQLTDYTASPFLLMAALAHDIAEAWTGDMPAQVKWRSAALKEALAVEEERINNDLNINFEQALDINEQMLLKAADMLDLMFYCYEERALGNLNMDKVMQNGYDWMRANISRTTDALTRARALTEILACNYVLCLNGRCEVK